MHFLIQLDNLGVLASALYLKLEHCRTDAPISDVNVLLSADHSKITSLVVDITVDQVRQNYSIWPWSDGLLISKAGTNETKSLITKEMDWCDFASVKGLASDITGMILGEYTF